MNLLKLRQMGQISAVYAVKEHMSVLIMAVW